MDLKCSELINLYNNLLSKKEEFYITLNKLDKEKIKDLKNIILEIRNIQEDINKIIDPIYKFREDIRPQILNQIKIYKDIFNIDITEDLKDLKIPEKQEGFDNILIIPKNISYNMIWDKAKEVFKNKVWIFDIGRSIDELIDNAKEQRSNTKIYSILIQNHKDNTEVPDSMRNKSADDVKDQEVLTLKEALLNYIIHFINTGEYLYKESCLICSGSHCPGGDVPYLRLHPGGDVFVCGYNVSDSLSDLGPCSVVSLHS